jgi:hypothetical protein
MNKITIISFALLLGCTGEKQEEELIAYITGEVTPDHPDVTTSAEFSIYKAFAFDDGGTFMAYFSSNPEAHCGDVTQYLSVDGPKYDPVEVLSPGKCNMYIKLTDWDGSFTGMDDPVLAAATSIECAMGEGSFEYTTLQSDDTDYFWTGDTAKWWQGAPHGYIWDLSGERGDRYTMDINMYEYSGAFIHEEFQKYDAFGSVEGTIEAYTCEGLASTGLF